MRPIAPACPLLWAILLFAAPGLAADLPASADAATAAATPAPAGTPGGTPAPFAGAGPLRAFGPGERLEFVLSWMGVAAGDSVMEVDTQPLSSGDAAGKMAWRVTSVTTSRSVADLVYKVRNRYETWLDPVAGFSLKYVVHQDEGGKKKDQVQIHDQGRSEVTLLVRKDGVSTSSTFSVPRGSVDTLSALYLVRNRDLAVGETLRYPVFEGKKSWELEVEVMAEEKVETGAGTFSAFKLHPRIKYEGIFRRKGDLFVWVTTDARHMPVLMKSEVRVGSISAELVRFTSGTSISPAGSAVVASPPAAEKAVQ